MVAAPSGVARKRNDGRRPFDAARRFTAAHDCHQGIVVANIREGAPHTLGNRDDGALSRASTIGEIAGAERDLDRPLRDQQDLRVEDAVFAGAGPCLLYTSDAADD